MIHLYPLPNYSQIRLDYRKMQYLMIIHKWKIKYGKVRIGRPLLFPNRHLNYNNPFTFWGTSDQRNNRPTKKPPRKKLEANKIMKEVRPIIRLK